VPSAVPLRRIAGVRITVGVGPAPGRPRCLRGWRRGLALAPPSRAAGALAKHHGRTREKHQQRNQRARAFAHGATLSASTRH